MREKELVTMSDISRRATAGDTIAAQGLVRQDEHDSWLIPVVSLSPETRLPMEDAGIRLQGHSDLHRFVNDYAEVRGVWASEGAVAVRDIVPVAEDASVLAPPPSLGTQALLLLPSAADSRAGIDLSLVRSVAGELVEKEAALHFVVVNDAEHFAVVVAATDVMRVEDELRPLLGSYLVVVHSQNTSAMLRLAQEILANEDRDNNLLLAGEAMSPNGDYRVVGIVKHWTSALSAVPASALEVRAWIHPYESKEIS
ncbi:hypothetical protein CQ040_09885 [Microbacterium sp. MYb54]|nr:hypothetical protein CQ032_11555 [Microbacterium sp. MYb43]PRB21115.1 hypothetical protein CQ040_09885 [Microbacterium sp. MYb54]PRB26297.1 hypothetical protein CQ037_13320 [Microbacterium sp. MYb50]PRB66936.1 hypothetical protein CQ021_09575 [Microbacterium sp. MYb24]